MKTKLFYLLFLLTVFFGKSQININEGFESGALPSGWTNNGFSFLQGGFAYNGTGYASAVVALGTDKSLTTMEQTSDGAAMEVSIVYRKQPNPAGFVGLYYKLAGSPTLNQITTEGFGTALVNYHTISGLIPAGTIPSGQNVSFVIRVAGQAGTVGEVMFDDFKVVQSSSVVSYPIEYTFNNTRMNANGLNPFSAGNTSFVADRNSIANNAMKVDAIAAGSVANIPALPKGALARSVALWYKVDANSGYPSVFSYGTSVVNQIFGLYIGPNGNPIFQCHTNDKDFGGTFAANTWHHVVITYNGTTVKMYMNGTLLGSQALALNTGNNSDFKLGSAAQGIAVDNLSVFDRELTATEVSNMFNPAVATAAPIVSYVSESVTTTSGTIAYSINANGGHTTSVIKYGLASNALTNQVLGFSASDSVPVSNNITISSLQPNTVYYYQVEATNSIGTTIGAIDSFTTAIVDTPATPITEYKFDNTYTNVTGTAPFASNAGTSFVADRHGNANKAININSLGTTATITGLPYGYAKRSVSLWVKMNVVKTDYNFVYNYGNSANGAFLKPTTATQFGSNVNHIVNVTNSANQWYHYVFTYDGTTNAVSKIYRDGVLVESKVIAYINTGNNSDIFRLGLTENGGIGYFDGAIDDLKIYNYVLSDSEVQYLYLENSGTLGTENFSKTYNIEVYPNPVTDVLNVKTSLNIKSIEIYNLVGNKVQVSTSNIVDVKDLPTGVYMVKITDSEGKITTKKIIKK